jgi:hypothetical protein
VVPYGDGDSLVIHAGEDRRICFMATPGDSPNAMDRIEADARLITAGPELLKALKKCAAVCAGETLSKSAITSALDAARNAIAAAEGRTND